MNDQNGKDSEKQGMVFCCESHKCHNQMRSFKVKAERGDFLIVECITCGWRKEVVKRTHANVVQKPLKQNRQVAIPQPVQSEPSKVVSVGDMRLLFDQVDSIFSKRRPSVTKLRAWNNFQKRLEKDAVSSSGIQDILFEELSDSISLNAHAVFSMARAIDWLEQKIVGFKK